MKHSEHERLLREILANDATEGLRAASLAGMLAAARRRRRRRAWVSGAAASLAVVMTVLVLSHREARRPANLPAPEIKSQANSVKIINDEQLLALFPDRSVALIGRAGEQKLLFLDGGGRP